MAPGGAEPREPRVALGFQWKSPGAKQCSVISWLSVTTSDSKERQLIPVN